MSAICGIYHADESPIDPDLLLKMRDIVDYRGPDGAGLWCDKNIGLAHRLLVTTQESVGEKQPMTNGRGLWITADCRIDNRDELKDAFLAKGMREDFDALPDTAFILAAYELWGEDAPNRLLGDFAFAIWNVHERSFFCARDPLGLKPFYFHWNGRKFLFSSEIKQIFQDRELPTTLDLCYIGAFLIAAHSEKLDTPYAAVRRLLPGNAITLNRTVFRMVPYWRWDPDSEPLSGASLRENAEKFRHIFRESVRARLRVPSGFRSAVPLSGGLDSSSIVALAASAHDFEAGSLPVFSLYFPEAESRHRLPHTDPVDESPYADALIRKYGLESHKIFIRGWGPFRNLNRHFWHLDGPVPFPNLAYFEYLYREMALSRSRITLTGEGGDELFWMGPACVAELLRKGCLLAFAEELRGRNRIHGASYPAMINRVLRQLAPRTIRGVYRRVSRRRQALPSWIDGRFAAKSGLSERAAREFLLQPQYHRSPSYGTWGWIKGGTAHLLADAFDKDASAYAMETRYPFVDLRLLRFMAAVPWQQKSSKGVTKLLLREALRDILPAEIHGRLFKTDFSPVIRTGYERYLLSEMVESFENPHPCLRMMIRTDKVRELHRCFFSERPSAANYIFLRHLWYIVAVDRWLKLRSLKPEYPHGKESEAGRDTGREESLFRPAII